MWAQNMWVEQGRAIRNWIAIEGPPKPDPISIVPLPINQRCLVESRAFLLNENTLGPMCKQNPKQFCPHESPEDLGKEHWPRAIHDLYEKYGSNSVIPFTFDAHEHVYQPACFCGKCNFASSFAPQRRQGYIGASIFAPQRHINPLFELKSSQPKVAQSVAFDVHADVENAKLKQRFPASYWQLMQRCWAKHPTDRPTAADIILALLQMTTISVYS